MSISNLRKGKSYKRQEIFDLATSGKSEKRPYDFFQTGYGRADKEILPNDIFAFINIDYEGHADQIFPNKYDSENDLLIWYGKKKTHSNQNDMMGIISGEFTLHCFARWSDVPEFKYLGAATPLDYEDRAPVIDKDGTETFALKFTLSFKNQFEDNSPAYEKFKKKDNDDDGFIEGQRKRVNKQKILEKALSFNASDSQQFSGAQIVKRRKDNSSQKKYVAQLEDWSCQICNWSMQYRNSKNQLVNRIDVDHIKEKAKGGDENIKNLWALCPNCHAKKTLGVIKVDLKKKKIYENGEEIQLHHDEHLFVNLKNHD